MKKTILTTMATLAISLTLSTKVFSEPLPEPNIVGQYAITLDVNTGEIIYAKNADAKAYPASITKLMSAILLEKNLSKEDLLTYTANAKVQPSSAINTDRLSVPVGQQISADTALKTMLLASANDMTEMVATNIPKRNSNDNTEFIAMMNAEAQRLGMVNTHFVTSNGLDDNTNEHLTTAYDLTILGREVAKNPWTREIWPLKSTIIAIPGLASFEIGNTNQFVYPNFELHDPTCIGSKTGYTDKAGRCLLSIFERDNRQIIGVVLNSQLSPNDLVAFNDMKQIIDYSYSAEKKVLEATDPATGVNTSYKKDTTVLTVPVEYKVFKTFGPRKTIEVPVILDDDLSTYTNEINSKDIKLTYDYDINIFSNEDKNILGTLTLKQRENSYAVNLYTNLNSKAMRELDSNSYSLLYGVIALGAGFLVLVMLSLMIVLRKKKIKGNKYKL
ncbi:D-alanyl-D-alanine carboxypeptidase family protein [Clostridium cellulovorans]|uniref:Peptidase S11 D-alanyl-D-alanine carboxypeptidase 1 n=1 Tax=Clostridium cellulovorans (strain ATCC 35296 / DSM 3052 / OCM 3 / 743B) TaxID=573061 RepID=D9SWS5_CLOC7|nr:D-alanyl-D-alanine carboxypeptidase [Clostridium cellulovorans]ADL51286.1 peptidase S11 D-alanyl-D-alanine carboxypeptidase 1 [Clostridium cellulovorans 743B]